MFLTLCLARGVPPMPKGGGALLEQARYTAQTEKRDDPVEAGSQRVHRQLRDIYFARFRERRSERARITADTGGTAVCRAQRARRQLPLCAGQVDGEGSRG